MTTRQWVAAGLPAIVLATLVTYLPAIRGGFIWDDDSYITANRFVRNQDLPPMDGLRRVWIPGQSPQYYPVVFSMFWAEFQLWGENPLGYHLINVLLHIIASLLIWRVLVVIRIPGGGKAAWLVAALFALHPVNVESVAWITERKNVLSACFYLSAMLSWLRFDAMRDLASTENHRESWGWYGASLLLFLLALLSKSITCSLPAALILIVLYQHKPLSIARLAPLAPMFIIGLVLALHTAQLEREHVGAEGPDWDFSFAERCLIASKCLMFYPWKLLWPHPVMFVYPRWDIDGSDIFSYWSIVVVLIIMVACLMLWRRGLRGPFIALSYYAGTVLPAIGFFNVYPHRFSFVADHFLYLAGAGVLTFLISGLVWLLRTQTVDPAISEYNLASNRMNDRSSRALAAICVIVLPCFAILSYGQSGTYESAESVYRDTIAKNPRAWMAQLNLASRLLHQADQLLLQNRSVEATPLIDEARIRAEIGVELVPHVPQSHTTLSEALRLQGQYERALDHQLQGIAIVEHRFREDPRSPKPLAKDYFALARLYHLLKRFPETEQAFRRALEITPEDPLLNFEFAQFLVRQDRPVEALPHYHAVLRVNPRNYVCLLMVARIAKSQAHDVVAAEYFERARKASVDAVQEYGAASELVLLLASSDDPAVRNQAAATQIIEQYVAITQRQSPGLLDVLASVHFAAGRIDDAIVVAEEAITKANLAGAYGLASDIQTRLDQYHEASQNTNR